MASLVNGLNRKQLIKNSMVLGFKKQFKEPILAGTKHHSIREDLHDRWRPGLMIQMATGTRSKYYDCFKETPCISFQRIIMQLDTSDDECVTVSVSLLKSNECLNEWNCECLAKNDGFADFADFIKWWVPVLAKKINNRFEGKIIHWTDLRY